jgi:outer membrane immunogenic protein
MKFKKLACLAFAMTAAGVVQAEGEQQWGGAYVGANAGLSSFQTETADYWCWYACDAPGNVKQGSTFGLNIGYNFQLDDNFVVGVEADHNSGQDANEGIAWSNGNDGVLWNNELDNEQTLRVRVGLAVDNTLVYVTGGLARADVTHEALEFEAGGTNLDRAMFDGTARGLVSGIGVEHQFMDNVSFRMEYVTTQYEKESACWADNAGCDLNPGEGDDQVHWTDNTSSIRAGVNWIFF